MHKIKSFALTGLILGVILSIIPLTAHAQTPTPSATSTGGSQCSGGTTIFPHWYDGLCENGTIKSPNEVGNGTTAPGGSEQSTTGTRGRLGTYVTIIAMNIVRMLLYVVGYVSLGFIIWGGIKYIISQGDSGGITSAKKTILNAVIGLVLSIFSVAIVTFVAGSISK